MCAIMFTTFGKEKWTQRRIQVTGEKHVELLEISARASLGSNLVKATEKPRRKSLDHPEWLIHRLNPFKHSCRDLKIVPNWPSPQRKAGVQSLWQSRCFHEKVVPSGLHLAQLTNHEALSPWLTQLSETNKCSCQWSTAGCLKKCWQKNPSHRSHQKGIWYAVGTKVEVKVYRNQSKREGRWNVFIASNGDIWKAKQAELTLQYYHIFQTIRRT